MLVVGANGAGKTNLLESLHVGTQGFSPRTRGDAQLIRFGETAAHVGVSGDSVSSPRIDVLVRADTGKEIRLNGARVATESLRSEVTALVFTPDRLAVVKAGPGVRRAYVDRALARLLPSRSSSPVEYAAALGQRNAALRRAAVEASSRAAVRPWTVQVADLGAALVDARRQVVSSLSPLFAERAGELGLDGAEVVYEGSPPSLEALEARLERDLERGTTGIGPHLDEIRILSRGRDLRSFGSQGEQRIAVLALLLAESQLIAGHRPAPPLMLLDDVFSELDGERSRSLTALLSAGGQTVITATARGAIPGEPRQVLEVTPGRVREV